MHSAVRRRRARGLRPPDAMQHPHDDRRTGFLAGYAGSDTMPLGGYAALLAAWSALFGTLWALAIQRRRLPERPAAADVLLLGVATHKLTRILTKDWVTAPLRAPFVRYEESLGGGEVKETSRGHGLQRAVGDLLTCPFCTGPWVAGALMTTLVARPRAARTLAGTFAAVAVSDFLHQLYAAAKRSAG